MSSRIINPERFNQLSAADQEAYKKIQATFKRTAHRINKAEIFPKIFKTVDYFVQKDKLRALVCGFYKVSYNKLLINVRQFKILLGSCKSQINNLLKKAGFITLLERPHAEELTKYLGLHPKDPQVMQWSYRLIPENVSVKPPLEPIQPEQLAQPQNTPITLEREEEPSNEIHFPEPRPESELEIHFPSKPEMYSIPSPLPVEYDAYNDYKPIDIEVDISDPRDYLL